MPGEPATERGTLITYDNFLEIEGIMPTTEAEIADNSIGTNKEK